MSKLKWIGLFDENNNVYYEAESPYNDEGIPFYWRLCQKLIDGKIQWCADHDPELMERESQFWPSIDEAKDAIEKIHDDIISDLR